MRQPHAHQLQSRLAWRVPPDLSSAAGEAPVRAICDLNDLHDDHAIDVCEVLMVVVDSVEPNLRMATGSQCVLGKAFVDEQGQVIRTEPLCQDDRDKLAPLLDSLPSS